MDRATTPSSGTRRISLTILFVLLLLAFVPAPPLCADTDNFVWAKAMGGTLHDYGYGMAVDSAGNVYVTGSFTGSVDFDPGPGTSNLISNGSADIFVSKLDRMGNFVWARSMGGTDYDEGYGIAVDSMGNVYITGDFQGTADLDPGPGTFNLTSSGSDDIFVSKLDNSGNYVWARSMGGAQYDYGDSIAIDSAGNVYTTGYFSETADFDPGPGMFNLISNGSADIFINKLDNSGNYVWARSIGGVQYDSGNGIALDSAGNLYTTGLFSETVDFDPGPGTFNLISNGGNDVFISKLDSSGDLIWARAMGGTLTDWGNGIALDSAGNLYTTGLFSETVDFDPGAGTFNLISNGGYDIFISKLDSSGNMVWTNAMGGTQYDSGNGIAVDSKGNVYTTGSFSETVDFDPGLGTFSLVSNGVRDIFINKLDSSGNLVSARSMGGTLFDVGLAIAIDSSSNVYTVGSFEGTADFDPGPRIINLTSNGGRDFFVSKLGVSDIFPWPMFLPAITNGEATPLIPDTVTGLWEVFLTPDATSVESGPMFLNLSEQNGSITGEKWCDPYPPAVSGNINGKEVTIYLTYFRYGIALQGTINGLLINGTYSAGSPLDPETGTWRATKIRDVTCN